MLEYDGEFALGGGTFELLFVVLVVSLFVVVVLLDPEL
jgi:hypothetical protein